MKMSPVHITFVKMWKTILVLHEILLCTDVWLFNNNNNNNNNIFYSEKNQQADLEGAKPNYTD